MFARRSSGIRATRMACAGSVTSNCKVNGLFSIENHRFSGAILYSFCIFNRKLNKKLAFILQFAVRRFRHPPGTVGSLQRELASGLGSRPDAPRARGSRKRRPYLQSLHE